MVTIRHERPPDIAAREALLDRCFGPTRSDKPSQRLRDGRRPAPGLAFVAVAHGRIVGTVRLWNVSAGPSRPALLLGPLAVDPPWRGRRIGAALMRRALAEGARLGHGAVLLVGDAAYYGRFGFAAARAAALHLPGNDAPERLLGLELVPQALAGATGAIRAPAPAQAAGRTHRRGADLPQAA